MNALRNKVQLIGRLGQEPWRCSLSKYEKDYGYGWSNTTYLR